MLKKLLLLSFALVFIASFVNAAPRVSPSALMKSINAEVKVKIVGDAVCGYTVSTKKVFNGHNIGGTQKDLPLWPMDVTVTHTGAVTIYDMQSNGSSMECIQNPNNANQIHIVCTHAPLGDGSSFPTRRVKYYYSSNKGVSFNYIADVPAGFRAGFTAITLDPNGRALIGNHNASNTGSTTMAKFYYDAAVGLGSFTELYNTAINAYIWPRLVMTSSLTNPVKFVSVQSPNGIDSCFWNACTSLSPAPGTFGPWNFLYSDQAETYSLARGQDGRIGLAYKVNDVLLAADYGDVFFMESTDNGTTFGSPTKIFDANISPSGDSLGMLRGICLVYQGNVPKIVFEAIKQTTAGSFYPSATNNHIRFWSTSLPGSDPNRSIKLADTNDVGWWPVINTSTSTNDVLATFCRPTIGRSATGNVLFAAFMTPNGYYTPAGPEIYVGGSVDTVSFNRVWLTYSTNGGLNWAQPQQITPFDTNAMRDWTYPSISPTNDVDGNNYYVNLSIQSDSLPGSFVNFTGNGESGARINLVRVKVPLIGVNTISNVVPNAYSLQQNYPNPFNPVTSIRFSIPKVSVVTLKVYDITGKLVSTLVNNETISIGEKEVTFDASNLSSGVYFYSIKAGDFSDTKKMVVIK